MRRKLFWLSVAGLSMLLGIISLVALTGLGTQALATSPPKTPQASKYAITLIARAQGPAYTVTFPELAKSFESGSQVGCLDGPLKWDGQSLSATGTWNGNSDQGMISLKSSGSTTTITRFNGGISYTDLTFEVSYRASDGTCRGESTWVIYVSIKNRAAGD